MTVEDLISLLQQQDPKAKVVIPHEWDMHQRTFARSVVREAVEISVNGTILEKEDGQDYVVFIDGF
ncbi:hypothetical protein OE519_31425 [Pseudomonas aeruginosa]|uniref:hypothetical protein n=1 Tax=Pseudomonas aeruginosa TaxID=287 RepID=UPI0006669859|nr:hypothetical protein [Pseudomonas aeruginosa]EKT8670078.1 hypothetical protein [Pseudomonas aeruginosa]KSF27734.1 hypothetical protein AO933_27075 [Pseudomonas aeruginosa]MBU5717542.1 hypothetical protein [Pseudomonas aeruginosa]MBU5787642.1 hypothetical protein [Pseudomonas aeruginosa]MCU8948299.1 hypothetical protein [Pseudomonas aeruginosa]